MSWSWDPVADPRTPSSTLRFSPSRNPCRKSSSRWPSSRAARVLLQNETPPLARRGILHRLRHVRACRRVAERPREADSDGLLVHRLLSHRRLRRDVRHTACERGPCARRTKHHAERKSTLQGSSLHCRRRAVLPRRLPHARRRRQRPSISTHRSREPAAWWKTHSNTTSANCYDAEKRAFVEEAVGLTGPDAPVINLPLRRLALRLRRKRHKPLPTL